jgi:phosphinothricin acetyltransferase
MLIRPTRQQDFESVLAIYNHYVEHSHVTFDVERISPDDTPAKFSQFADSGPYRLVVAENDANVVGYACSMPFRPKPAYSTSVEVGVYVRTGFTGQGVGRKLYASLLDALEAEDVHRAYAVIALPNPASIRLHEQFGFCRVATLREVGRKFGKYWDVTWWERSLDPS